MKKFPLAAKGRNDCFDFAVVSNVASGSARHEYFDAELLVFFQEEDSLASRSGTCGSHQPGCSGSNDDYIPVIQVDWGFLGFKGRLVRRWLAKISLIEI